MLIHNANVTGSMHLNGMDMSTITGSVSTIVFNQFSSSTNEFTGSTNTRITNLDNASGSFSTRVTSLESFSASLDATFATDAQLTSLSSSVTQRLAGDESTITSNSSSFASRLTTDESTISSLQTASGSFSTRVTSNESNISSLQTASGSFSTRTTNLETASGSFSTRVTNTENNTTNNSSSFASRLTTDESNISSLQTASGSFSTRTTSNESNISSLQTASGSFSTRVTSNESNISSLNSRTGSYATIEGPNSFNGNQTVTGSLFVTQNLTVLGSSSISYVSQSNLNIGTNLITVNAQNPSVRFGGLAVIDSGSSPQVSGSWLFDSIQNRWIMIHEQAAGNALTSSIALMGPETYNNLGNETTITLNRIIKGSAGASGEHVGDSQISDDGTTVSIPGRLVVTGSITGSLDGSNITNSSISNAKLANSSVTVTAGSGLSGGGSVALGSSITLTNAAPDQTVTLTNGSNITITGTYPNFTLTNGVTNNNQLTNGAGYITGINSSAVTTALGYTPVTNARTLTINGTTYDLSADRTWSIAAGVTSFNTRTGAITLSSGDVTGALGYTPVTNARTLTINGTAYDLSADRSWTIAAGVSSVTAGTGISVSGTGNVTISNTGLLSGAAGTGISVSTVNGTLTITSTGLLSGAAGTGISVATSNQQLTITNTGLLSGAAGTGISVSTSNQQLTITNTGLLSTTAGTGISISTSNQNSTITNTGLLSGTAGTGISVSTSSGNLTITNSGVTSNVAGTGISVSGATGAVTITNSGVTSITAGSGISISGATGGVTITNTITNNNQLTNGAGYITGITSSNVTTALGYTPYNSSNPSGYITGINSSMVTNALGYTPYNSSNPSGYITGLSFDGLSSKTGGSGTYQTSGDFRAPIFYDSNNTGFYLDPNSSGTSLRIAGNIYSDGSFGSNGYSSSSPNVATTIFAPKGAAFSSDGSTGAIRIKLPFRASNPMWTMKVRIYNYSTNQTSEYLLGNYSYDQGGYNSSATFLGGDSATAHTVRFGNQDGVDCVWIGETNTSWSYPVVSVLDFTSGFRGSDAGSQGTGWNISVVTSFGTVATAITPAIRLSTTYAPTFRADADMRAPIFYDSNNTAFYLDPASTSVLSALTVGGSSVVTNNGGTWGINISGTAGSISGFNNPTTSATANTIAYRDASGDITVRELVMNVAVQDFTPSSMVAIYPTTNQAVKVTASGARGFLNVPTRTGGDASGTWGINVTGTAGSETLSTVTGRGSNTTSQVSINREASINTTTPGTAASYGLHFGGQTTADLATGLTFSAGNATSTNANAGIYVQGSGAYGTRMYIATTDSYATGARTAITINEGGTVTINRSFLQSNTDLRAPIFYDSNNTGYYLDPTSTTSIRTVGSWRADSSTWDGEFSGKMQYHSNHWYIQAADLLIYRNSGGSNVFTVNQSGNTVLNGQLTIGNGLTSSDIYFTDTDEGTRRMHCNSGRIGFLSTANGWGSYSTSDGSWRSDQAMYSPIYYDLNDTGYYVDPASTSVFLTAAFTRTGDHAISVGTIRGRAVGSQSGEYIQLYERVNIGSPAGWGSRNAPSYGLSTYGGADLATDTGFTTSGGSMRSPIFYDSNDTGYYADFNSSGTSIKIGGGIITTSPNGSILLKHEVPEANAWIFRENAANWGLFWFNAGNQSGQTIGSYTTIGAELFGMNNAVTGYNPNSAWSGTDSSTRAAWMLSNYSGYLWTQGTQYSETDMRAPIFYDANDTGRYIDPASTSQTNSMRASEFRGNANVGGTGEATWHPAGAYVGGTMWQYGAMYKNNTDIYDISIGYANSSFRAPIFYDSNNTGYYIDAASTSVLSSLKLISNVNYNPRWDFTCYVVEAQHWYGNNSSMTMYMGEASNTIQVPGSGGIRPQIMYDYNDTGYYADFNSTSDSALRIRGGALHGPNPTWGKYLLVGGDGRQNRQNDTDVASVCTTNGNLHLDAASGLATYINHYDGNVIYFGGGANNNWGEFSGGIFYSYADTRSPIYYDYNDTAYYLNPNGASYLYSLQLSGAQYFRPNTWIQMDASYGMYWPNHYGLHVYANDGGSYGALQIGGSKGGWSGIYFNVSGNTLMMNSNEAGFHQQGVGWQFRWYQGQIYCHRGTNGGGTSYIVMDEGNIASYTAGNVNSISSAVGGGYTWTGINYFRTNFGGYCGSLDSGRMQAYSDSNNSAFFSFHKGGHYAVNMGLDADNVIRIGGWSAAANRWQLDMSGNMTVAGDVTAYSDARVKTNVNTIENALEKTLALRGVTYNRTDSEDVRTKVGVIAQEIIEVLPEVVNQDNDGMYNVSYGNITALLIEAIKEQQSQIEELKSIINGLTK